MSILVEYPVIEGIAFGLVIGLLCYGWAKYKAPCAQDMEFYLKREQVFNYIGMAWVDLKQL